MDAPRSKASRLSKIEAVLNHISGHKAGVAGVYNRALYAKEKTIALTRWAEHLSAIVGPKGMVR